VNLLAFSGFPEGRGAQMDFSPTDTAAFKSVAKANKWKLVGPKHGFVIQGDDRVGAIADIVGTLADAKIKTPPSTRSVQTAGTGRSAGSRCATSRKLRRSWALCRHRASGAASGVRHFPSGEELRRSLTLRS